MVAAMAPHSSTSIVARSQARTPATMRWQALDILEVLHTRDAKALIRWLVGHDSTHEGYVAEAWGVAAAVQVPPADPATLAVKCRQKQVHKIPRKILLPADPGGLQELLLNFAKQSNFALHGDSFVALRLRALLPERATVFAPRYAAAYQAAATHFGDDTNVVVRPLLTTPIRDVLENATWSVEDVGGFCAGAVTLREMLGDEPHVYIGPDCAAAGGVSLAWLDGRAGVIDGEGFHTADGPLHALWEWARRNPKGAPVVAAALGNDSPFARFAGE